MPVPSPSEAWLAADWKAPPGVVAGVSLRAGGASHGTFAGRNVGLSVGDDPAVVRANRDELSAALGLERPPLWLEQVHGTAVADADAVPAGSVPRADAAVTRSGRCLAIQTADCLPVLVATQDGAVLGAAHAGWRGLAAGVVEALLDAMDAPGEALVAWLGPAISAANYEVDDPVRAAFVAADPAHARYFAPTRPGHYRCDLAGVAASILTSAGVADVRSSRLCTYADAERFYSYRRDGRTGRQVSFIARIGAPAAS